MFNSGILDVVIGVVVIYLQLSLVCTAFHELVALAFKKRAKELEKGILGLLTKPELVDKFYAHPLIQGLCPDGRKPSYIPSATFALTLMDIVRRHSFDGTLNAATQAVTEKTTAQVTAQAALDAAATALTSAETVRKAAEDALTAAGAADKLAAAKALQDAANQQAAAESAKSDAQIKLTAAIEAKTQADTYVSKLERNVATARGDEKDAQTKEAAAKQDPTKVNLQKAAAAARLKANASANLVDPSAASLLTEARDKVAGVQDDVVPPELKTALLALMDNAGTNLTKGQANVEQWFNNAMDRVSGVYKRKSHVFVVIIAVIVTVMANVDTLQVADTLSHDKALRESLVAAAPELAKADAAQVEKERATATPTPTTGGTVTPASPKRNGAATPIPSPNPTPKPSATPTPAPTPSLSTIKASLDELKKFGLPIGYIRVCTPEEEKDQDSCETTNALLKGAEETRTKAEKKSKDADADFKTAKENDKASTADTKAALSAALSKAETERTNALAELKQAEGAHSDAVANAAKVRKIDLQKAEAEAKANPTDEKKQKALEEARKNATLSAECQKCRKASELTANEMKQRLPTTQGHDIFSGKFRPVLSDDYPAAFSALFSDIWNLLYAHWLGWLLTAFAISLGAPFWFDMLNKLIVVRSTVKPHEKSREQDSKDNPDDKDEKKKT